MGAVRRSAVNFTNSITAIIPHLAGIAGIAQLGSNSRDHIAQNPGPVQHLNVLSFRNMSFLTASFIFYGFLEQPLHLIIREAVLPNVHPLPIAAARFYFFSIQAST